VRAINHHRQISLLGRKAESRYLLALRTSASPETFWESHPESDPNRGYAVTFFFYRVNKTQTVKFTLEAIERRVVDPAADTKVYEQLLRLPRRRVHHSQRGTGH